jgi:protein O-mannosyl-transferase
VALDSIVFYLGKLFWPARLAVDYGLRPDVILRDRWLVGKCLLVATIALSLWLLRRRAKPVVGGGLIFLIPLLPVLGFLTFDFQWYSNVADHYLYMPMLGIALAVAWACQKWNHWAIYAGSASVLILLAVIGHVQGSVWENTQTLFAHNLAVNPTSSAAFDQFTRMALDQRDPISALSYARQEIARHPDDVYAYRASGMALGQQRNLSEAIDAYRRALAISPDDTLTLDDLAGVMMETGEIAKAEQFARHAAATDLDSADAHFDLGFILNQEKKLTEAKEQFERAVALDPDSDRYHNLLAKVLEETGQRDLAIAQYNIALQLNPNSGPAKAGLRRLGGGD